MTTGQRIAQKRKEQGLSQEALGEQLGVSRQSVYKWESDTALPEIDKLVALSRLFSVSLGWLLGVEEQESAGGELTETQLKLVEEIAGRYLAAQQTPERRIAWRWAAGAAAAVAALAIGLGAWGAWNVRALEERMDQLDRQDAFLGDQLSQTWAEADRRIMDAADKAAEMAEQMETLKERHYNLTEDFGVEFLSADPGAGTASFTAWVMPEKEESGSPVFQAETEEGAVEIPGELGPEGRYYASFAAPLTDSVTISMYYQPGGVQDAQVLERFQGLRSATFPTTMLHDRETVLPRQPGEDDSIAWKNNYIWCDLDDGDDATAEIRKVRVGLFRNRELAFWLEPSEAPERYAYMVEGKQFFKFPDGELELENGDSVHLVTYVTDVYGREQVLEERPFQLKEKVSGRLHMSEMAPDTRWYDQPLILPEEQAPQE